ncbi:SDR family NAD(P)-dependent oxidoreductase [Pseudonocardia phyllosphaerae]|uniref:SDR family NAD(P)-dependent oxidoreductase n=1 Tax=Pseudonocardia phyllosphaerae TaxID=3390502 RepID=UPI00397A07B6
MFLRSTTTRSPIVPPVPVPVPAPVSGEAGYDGPAAVEVLDGVDLTGRRAVVTGAASGVGYETARALAAAGAEVTLAVDDADAGALARAGIVADTGNEQVRVGELDLADQHSISRFVRLWDGPLHVLVDAAGPAATTGTTVDGWDPRLAVGYLGPAALTTGLHWALTAVDGARVVHLTDPARDDAHVRPAEATALHTAEAARRWAGDAIAVNTVHRTAVPGRDAATVVLAAASPLAAGISGSRFAGLAEAGPAQDPYDPAAARGLWDRTERTLREVWLPGLAAA